ncbi:MAG: histidinol-phosphate transaminase [Deltaproteobacteria bacterium]|nr:histidinol-phosphate transaminase [Deltaproteobacteria bacterium]
MTHVLTELCKEELRELEKYQVPHHPGIRAKLDANEHPYPLDAEVATRLGAHLARVALNRYPDGECRELRAILSRDLGCAPEELCFGNGSDELISLLIGAFGRPRPGAAHALVAYPWPSFVYYRIATWALGARPLEVPLREDFTLDPVSLDAALRTHRPNMVFLALPNNPTGTLWPRDEVVRVIERFPDTLVIADEAYVDYSGETMRDLFGKYPNLLIMRTFSKMGLAGLRVGYLLAPSSVAGELEKIRPPYNIGNLNQAATAWLLTHARERLVARVREVVDERERLYRALAELPRVRVFPTRANLMIFRYGEPGDGQATALWHKLLDQGVLVRNFDRPGPLQGCLRVTVGTPEENALFLEAMGAVARAA